MNFSIDCPGEIRGETWKGDLKGDLKRKPEKGNLFGCSRDKSIDDLGSQTSRGNIISKVSLFKV